MAQWRGVELRSPPSWSTIAPLEIKYLQGPAEKTEKVDQGQLRTSRCPSIKLHFCSSTLCTTYILWVTLQFPHYSTHFQHNILISTTDRGEKWGTASPLLPTLWKWSNKIPDMSAAITAGRIYDPHHCPKVWGQQRICCFVCVCVCVCVCAQSALHTHVVQVQLTGSC